MVDMVLDAEKSRTYDCSTCDIPLQVNRNCSGIYGNAILKLNDTIYQQCPRSIIFNCREEKYLVDLYFDCKDKKVFPSPGSLHQQTAFTQDLFDYLDGLVNIFRSKQQKEQEAQLKKSQDKVKSSSKTK